MSFVLGFFYSVVSLILGSLFIPLFYCFNYSNFVVNEVTQSCPTLCDPMDCSLPGSSVHGIFQARVLAWVVIPFCRGSSRPGDRMQTLYHLNRSLISGSMMPPVLLSIFKIALAIQGLLWFHTNFQIVQSIPVKYAIEILIVSDLNL